MGEKILSKIGDAVDELKRVEHQIYVSLKYTRTVDVILNCLHRMVEGYEHLVDVLLLIAEKQGKDVRPAEGAIGKAELVAELFSEDPEIVDNMELYILIRRILRAKDIQRTQEYRRHVTLKTIIDNREEIVNIDIITNYYFFERDFLRKVKRLADEVLRLKKEESNAQ